jgi:hypothetical protein
MRPLSAAQLLAAWERGLSETVCRRSLPLLAAASANSSIEELARLSVGERDRRLLALRVWTFGSKLASYATCSGCQERLEWTLNAGDLQTESVPPAVVALEVDRYKIELRVPNTLDLEALAAAQDLTIGEGVLLERCVVTAQVDGQETDVASLPEPVVTAIGQRMAQVDPQAEINFELHCPACGNRSQVLFDIESFFWIELNAWARRLLHEVHLLARAYGWSELEILNLSPWRRQCYLELASAS